MTATEITFELLGGPEVSAEDVETLHAEVYLDAADYPARLRVQRRQPGFVLAEARHGGYLIGYASGMPLRPSTDWWRHLTAPLPGTLTAEHQGRTFAVLDVIVRASWRRQRIGETLHDMILDGRTEERATAKVPSAATAAQNALQVWGWRKVGRGRDDAAANVYDVFVRPLTRLPAVILSWPCLLAHPGEVRRRTRDDRQRDDLRLVVAVSLC